METYASFPALAKRFPPPTPGASLANALTACVCPLNVIVALSPFQSLIKLSAEPTRIASSRQHNSRWLKRGARDSKTTKCGEEREEHTGQSRRFRSIERDDSPDSLLMTFERILEREIDGTPHFCGSVERCNINISFQSRRNRRRFAPDIAGVISQGSEGG